MFSATIQRARGLSSWAPFAPVFVANALRRLSSRSWVLPSERATIDGMVPGTAGPAEGWCCAFPALVDADAPHGLIGGIVRVHAVDPGMLPPRGAQAFRHAVDPRAVAAVEALGVPVRDLYVCGLPAGLVTDGRSATGAVWLAFRARQTGRSIPSGFVVSADLVPGAAGEPVLAGVEGGTAKAAMVSRELPEARLLLCAPGRRGADLPAGASVRALEASIWGASAVIDRDELIFVAAAARDAFDHHDYATAATRYERVAMHARSPLPADRKLAFEACLRLAAACVHRGRPHDANAWFATADGIDLSGKERGIYAAERMASLAGMHIDTFRPTEARAELETASGRHALAPENNDIWARIQLLGTWRRLHLLEGDPAAARHVQTELLSIADEQEKPRSALDLAWTAIRAGDLDSAQQALFDARANLHLAPFVYRLQSAAFLAWYVVRQRQRGGAITGLEDLIEVEAIDEMLCQPALQAAPSWRLRAVRATSDPADAVRRFEELAKTESPLQRWYLGLFLLEGCESLPRMPVAELRAIAGRCLATSFEVLDGFPDLDAARGRAVAAITAGAVDGEAERFLLDHAAY